MDSLNFKSYQIYCNGNIREKYKRNLRVEQFARLEDKSILDRIKKGTEWLEANCDRNEMAEKWYSALMRYEALCDEAKERRLINYDQNLITLIAKVSNK
jgi:hypothetical protein